MAPRARRGAIAGLMISVATLLSAGTPPASAHVRVPAADRCVMPPHSLSARGLRLRGGRERQQARWDEENEKRALDYLARLKEGAGSAVAPGMPDGDAAGIGVPLQVDEDEAESKRRTMVYPRSTLWQTTRRTALCIQLDDALWKIVNAVRVQHDETFDEWYFPAIKLANVFFTPDKLWEASDMVQQCVRDVSPFNVSLSKLRAVQHASKASLWLEPDEQSCAHILHLRALVQGRFPTLFNRVAKEGRWGATVEKNNDGSQPHVCLATCPDLAAAERLRETLLAQGGWSNLSFTATDVSVCKRSAGDAAVFDPYRVCPLGGGDPIDLGLEENMFVEAEKNLEDEGGFAKETSADGGLVGTVDAFAAGAAQQWNATSRRFEVVRGLQLRQELEARQREARSRIRAAKLARSDTMARDFLHLPSRFAEELRAAIPAELVERVRKMAKKFDGELLTAFVKGYQRRYKEKLGEVALRLGVPSAKQLLRHLKDVLSLSKRGQDVRVHFRTPDSVRERQARRAKARRALTAMRGRDVVEKDGLKFMQTKLARAEAKVIRKFRQSLTAREQDLMDSKLPAMRARERRPSPPPDTDDPELRKLYAELGGGGSQGAGGTKGVTRGKQNVEKRRKRASQDAGEESRDDERDGMATSAGGSRLGSRLAGTRDGGDPLKPTLGGPTGGGPAPSRAEALPPCSACHGDGCELCMSVASIDQEDDVTEQGSDEVKDMDYISR